MAAVPGRVLVARQRVLPVAGVGAGAVHHVHERVGQPGRAVRGLRGLRAQGAHLLAHVRAAARALDAGVAAHFGRAAAHRRVQPVCNVKIRAVKN